MPASQNARVTDPDAEPGLLRLVAHELRQPLTAALGSSLALSDRSVRSTLDPGDQQILLEIIKRNLHQIDRMLDTVHVFGELLSGTLQLEPARVPLGDLLEASRDAFDPLRATIAVVVRCDPDLMVDVDTTLMNQVLSNLLGNAKKFSPPGSEIVVEGGRDAERTTITVQDHGEGIPTEDLARIFDAGVSGDHSRGLGLGLYVCHAIVTAHGGRIWAEPVDAGGTRFTISLPSPGTGPLSDRPRSS